MADNNNLCIEDIMNEIRREIKEKNLTSDMLSFEDVPYKKAEEVSGAGGVSMQDAENALIYLNSHYNIQPYKELAGNPVSVFIKKVIRKLVKFYIEPVVFEQNDFNANTVHVINAFKNSIESKSSDEKGLNELVSRIEVLELSQKNLAVQIENLEKENKMLKEKLGKSGI